MNHVMQWHVCGSWPMLINTAAMRKHENINESNVILSAKMKNMQKEKHQYQQ